MIIHTVKDDVTLRARATRHLRMSGKRRKVADVCDDVTLVYVE